MGIGVVALQTSQKKEIAGPPFASNSADNGLSVDSVSSRIVLGNDVADPAQPAALLSSREIVTEDVLLNLFSIILNSIQTGITTTLDGQSILVAGSAGTTPFLRVTSSGGGTSEVTARITGGGGGTATVGAIGAAGDTAQLSVFRSAADQLQIVISAAGSIRFLVGNTVDTMAINTATFQTQVGPGLTSFNGADFQVSGSATYRHMVTGKGAGAYNVDRNLDSNVQFINSGAATFNLPSMAAGNNRLGFIFRVCVKNAGGVTIQLVAGQTGLFGSLSTTSGGTFASTDVGAYIKIIWDGSNWITETFNGAWTLT